MLSRIKGIFITGTDTGVGKTIATGLLARYLLDKGYSVITQKWIQTGCGRSVSTDIRVHFEIMGRDTGDLKGYEPFVSPYKFKIASSPHLASEIENKRINPGRIIKAFKFLSDKFDFIIVEGIGGALVPFNKKSFVIDIAKELDLPVLVVALNKLGAINHTLLTIEALEKRKLKILGVMFNNLKKEDKKITYNNPIIIKTFSNERVFGTLPWIENYNALYREFIPIGNKIYKVLCI